MEAPNLERSSSLTWAGMGGLTWDRTSVLPMVEADILKPRAGAPRLDEIVPQPIGVVDSILNDEEENLDEDIQPILLKRAVTFSGGFSGNFEDETLVAASPPILGTNVVQQRQRATSDADAIKAAWGSTEAGSLSPEGIFSYSPSPAHKMLPRRTHSMSADPVSVWGSDSPRERSRTTHTLSVGSPDTEVLEYLDGDELNFVSGSRQNQFPSPLPSTMYPAHPQSQNSTQNHRFQAPQQQATANQAPRLATPPFALYAASNAATNGISNGLPTPPAPPLNLGPANVPPQSSTPTPPITSNNPGEQQEQNLLEIQLQNLQAMQQQWMHMMQMQFDQTLYATQQRLQNMHVSGNGTPPPTMPFASPKTGVKLNAATNSFDPSMIYAQQPPLIPPPMMYQNASRTSPPAQRQHRRPENPLVNAAPTSSNYSTSSLLADHKITGRRLSAAELSGHVVEFSRDSHGSRLIQFKMETGTPEERRAFVNEALPHTLALARDLFGNYVIQNFFDNAAPDQRDLLSLSLMGNVNALCTHPHGCRVVQRALFVVSPARRNDLVEELIELNSNNPAQMDAIIRSHARDAHATHVLQKAVASLQKGTGIKSAYRDPPILEDQEDPPAEKIRASKALEKIEQFVLGDCLSMCTHQQACRLVQRILGACEPNKYSPRVGQVLSEVFRNIESLAIHQNGNFVLQHILESTDPALACKVQNFVCHNAIRLARHKFGSHLVEKCLACATPAQVNAIIERFLTPLTPEMSEEFKDDFESSANDDKACGLIPSTLPVLMKDPYANFVVQKAFDVSRGELRNKLSQEIRARTSSLSKFSYGRHILTHINRSGPSD